MCWFPRKATPVRGTSTHSLDVVNTPKTPGEGDHVDKKARPTQRSDTMPAARKTGMPIKMEVASASAVEKSAPVPKPSAPAKAPCPMPSQPPAAKPAPAQPIPAQPVPAQPVPAQPVPAQPVPAPSALPKGAAPVKRELHTQNDAPIKKATPPKVAAPVQNKASALPPAPTMANHVKTEPVTPVAPSDDARTVATTPSSATPSTSTPIVPTPHTTFFHLPNQNNQQAKDQETTCAPTSNGSTSHAAPGNGAATVPKASAQSKAPKAPPPPPAATPPKALAKTQPPAKLPPAKAPPPKATPVSSTAAASASDFQVQPGTAALQPGDYKERQAQYMVFKRQVSSDIPPPSVPVEFVEAWSEAVRTRSRAAKNALFSKWCEAGGNWGLILGLQLTTAVYM